MANPEHVEILRIGVDAWNRWRASNRNIIPNLGGAIDLSHLDLSGIDLSRADIGAQWGPAPPGTSFGAIIEIPDLTLTNFSGADLQFARMRDAKLTQANLSKAFLSEADLSGAGLDLANLTGATLYNTILARSMLARANFDGCRFGGTVLADVNLGICDGLDTVHHARPSNLDVATLIKSGKNLSQQFLRGVGVPEPFITNLAALINAMEPIQFYSCFISYSTNDQRFADRLHADLQNKGVRCWFAPHDVQGGKKLYEQIEEAIRLHDRVLLVLSDHSMGSEWVKTEIAHARQKELNEKRRVLFPISVVPFEKIQKWKCFDADTGKDSAREIREYFVPDFSNWKDHDAYANAFDRLVRDLKTEPSARVADGGGR